MQIKLMRFNEKWFFLLVLPIAIAIEWAFAATHDWAAYPRSEWVALIDLCVFVPLVYWFLFSSSLAPRARFLRTLGIAGLGLFASSFIVPEPNQIIIGELSAVRNGLLIFILSFEGLVLWKMLNALYAKAADAKSLERDFAMPAWVAKLMVLEAKFWKAVWSFVKRK